MKEILTLAAEKREGLGTHVSRRLRGEGQVPCVVYGHKQAPATLAVDHTALRAAIRHHARMLDLALGGAKERVIIQAVQYDALGIDIVHADFVRVAMDELLRIAVPVETRGRAKGEQHGGVAELLMTTVEIECLPADIPESISVVVSELDIGDSILVNQLPVPPKAKIVSDPNHLVVTVAAPKKVEEAPVAAAAVAAEPGAAEPEVITRGKPEEGEEGEEGAEGGKDKGKAKEKK
jgi:large subunit ribosomal protein L25